MSVNPILDPANFVGGVAFIKSHEISGDSEKTVRTSTKDAREMIALQTQICMTCDQVDTAMANVWRYRGRRNAYKNT